MIRLDDTLMALVLDDEGTGCRFCGEDAGSAKFDALTANLCCDKATLAVVTAERDAAHEALAELVDLKRFKDRHGKTLAYEVRQPGAWDQAFRVADASQLDVEVG